MEYTIQQAQKALRRRGLKTLAVGGNQLAYWGDSGNFRLSTLPGNTRVFISHAVWLPEGKRGRGLGRKLLTARIASLREAGAKLVLATVNNKNAREAHLLRKKGYRRYVNFGSTSLWGKVL